MSEPTEQTYASAGVDTAAADLLVSRIAEVAATAGRPEVISGVGPFAGLFRLGEYRDPVLIASTDSVGTKVKLASVLGRYEGVGHDLVNHCVNDVLTSGAEPLFFLDYIGNFGLSDDQKVDLVRGVADACSASGCALIGGETADMPGTYAEGDYDLVGFIVGVAERENVIDGSKIEAGDALIGLPSNGLHTNGYSLVRRIFGTGLGAPGQAVDSDAERAVLETEYPELNGTLGDALLVSHRCYLDVLKPVLSKIRGFAHITGGGLPGNAARIFPDGLAPRIDRGSWEAPAIFKLIQQRGSIADEEMFATFNMGVGAVLAASPADLGSLLVELPDSWQVGEVVSGEGFRWA